MSASKTEELIRACFKHCYRDSMYSVRFFARAARRFVRLEQAEKEKSVSAYRKNTYGPTGFPKHWGELKVGKKWVKF